MPRPSELTPIGEFARRVRLTPKQLRDYDELGLLAPAYVDADTGYRYYHRGQARTAVTIALLRSLDVPLPAIHDLLVGEDGDIARLLDVQRARIEAEVERGLSTLRSLDRLLSRRELLPYDISERDEPAVELHGLRSSCPAQPLEREVPRTIDALATLVGSERFDAEPVTGLYPLDLDGEIEFFVGIAAPVDTPDRVTLGPARVAATTHSGRISELQLSYFPLIAHVEERGLELTFDSDWFTQLAAGDAELGLVVQGHASIPPRFQGQTQVAALVTVEVDDARAAYERARRLEAPIELELRREEWGQLHFITRDPDGVAVDVIEVIPVTSAAIATQYLSR